jgi:cytochrome P450
LEDEIAELRKAKELPEGKTIFHEILRSDIPESEKEIERIRDEAMVLIVAGSETTASTMVAITYHLLSDRAMLARLKAELESANPGPNEYPDPAKLDNLPFLNALIQEAIRLYPGATPRQDRAAPDEDLIYWRPDGTAFTIPRGTGVGMTAPILNRHPDLYPDPDTFRPERFIEDPKLAKHTFSFSKGGRQCIGINLAYQELQTFTAGIFGKYDIYDATKREQNGPTLELYETKIEDVMMHADYVTPAPYEGSPGLRLRIRQ